MSVITRSTKLTQPLSTDPASVWEQSRRILYHVARKVRRDIRRKLDGHGRAEAELEELVNDSFICLMEALPRFNAETARFTTFSYGLARRRMWIVARAAFYGLSPEQMHCMDVKKRTPRFHCDIDGRRKRRCRSLSEPEADGEERQSVRKVDAIRGQLSRKDQRLIDIYLQEGGVYAGVGRRLRQKGGAARDRCLKLFRRIAAMV